MSEGQEPLQPPEEEKPFNFLDVIKEANLDDPDALGVTFGKMFAQMKNIFNNIPPAQPNETEDQAQERIVHNSLGAIIGRDNAVEALELVRRQTAINLFLSEQLQEHSFPEAIRRVKEQFNLQPGHKLEFKLSIVIEENGAAKATIPDMD